MTARWVGRLVVAIVVLGSLATLGYSYTTATASAGNAAGGLATVDGTTNTSVAPARDNITVIATDSNSWLGQESDGPRGKAELIALGPEGRVIYYNDSHTRYWDVDPVKGTDATVEYVYADHLNASECGGESVCTRNGVERVNLTTGEVTDVFSRQTPGKHSTRWHDVDRVSESELVVADIANDRVFRYNTSTDTVEWAWNAQADYSPAESGGPYPSDWTHLNDVEVLEDGRIMVSLRNHDQVVFLDPETGLQENQTLGADDKHEILYEQHNPDYIPKEQGGPAVLVADSEQNRIVEYQRSGDHWERTWEWRDDQAQWPRDADRLPNGHTLVTDSNGNRVIELDENGDVVWSVDVAFPYESERLGTGDESAGGPAASQLPIGNQSDVGQETPANESGGTQPAAGDGGGDSGEGDSGGNALLDTGRLENSIAYVLPVWMSMTDLAVLVVGVVVLVVWVGVELFMAPWSLRVNRPISITREGE